MTAKVEIAVASGVIPRRRAARATWASSIKKWSARTWALGPFQEAPGALAVEPLFQDKYVCILRPRHPLLTGPWSPRRFAGADHVLVTPRAESDRGTVDDALAAYGLSRRVTRVVPTFALAPQLVAGSDRIATLPESFARAYGAPLGLVLRAPPLKIPPVEMTMAFHLRHQTDPGHVWLRALVHDAMRAAGLARKRPRGSQ